MSGSPFVRDVPLPQALAAWADARAAERCPERVGAVTVSLAAAVGRVTAEPVWATRSSPAYDAAAMDGIAVRAAETVGASESTPLRLAADAFDEVDTGDPVPAGRDAVVMREHVHRVDGGIELQALLDTPSFRSAVEGLGGDSCAETGGRIR